MEENRKRIAMIGLGQMGGRMAGHLAAAGFEVRGYDPAGTARAAGEKRGVRPARSVAEAAGEAELVCSSLPTPEAVREAYLGAGGVLEAARKGTVCFEHSTSSVALAREIARAAEARGVSFLDVPVSGSVPHLERKELAAMASGDPAALDAHRDVLEAFCKSVTYFGAQAGNALTMKLVTNHMLYIGLASIAEGLAFGMKAGLDPVRMVEFLQGSAVPRLLFYKAPEMAARDYSRPIGDLSHSLKDLGLSIEVANGVGAPAPVGAAARQQFVSTLALGYEGSDINTVFEAYIHAMGGERKKPDRAHED